jgi:hypothetical protein
MKSALLAASLLMPPLLAQEALPTPVASEAVPTTAVVATPVVGDVNHPAIAVLPLRGSAPPSFGNPADAAYQRVTSAFFKTRRFTMIERAQLGALLDEGKNQNSIAFDEASAVALGKQVGAKIVVLGSYIANISRTRDAFMARDGTYVQFDFFPADIAVSLRLVNVETGKIQDVMDAKGTSRDSNAARGVSTALDDLGTKLDREVSNHFPRTGYVIKVLDDKRALIDLGKADGVNAADEFVVFERGEDIIHPVTGKVIKGAKKELTEFKVIQVEDDSAIVRVTGPKIAMKPGMALESKPKKRGFFEALNDTLLK